MSNEELIDQFDVLFNSITSNKAPSLNTYEKSVFLNKAQYELVKNYFEKVANPKQKGFDESPKRQADFSTIIRNTTCELSGSSGFDDKSLKFKYPKDLFIILNEKLMQGDYPYIVAPIDYNTYDRVMAKPYKYPPIGTAWRIITNNDGTPFIEIRANFNKDISPVYKIRYVKKPRPIILEDLSYLQDNLTIDGISEATECELPEETHPEILQRAVELAKVAWSNDLTASIQAGGRSE